MTFVFLHGIEQQNKTADELRTLCIESIRVGIDRAGLNNPLPSETQFIVPYYGDLLAKLAPVVNNETKGPSSDRGAIRFGQANEIFHQRAFNTTLEQLLNEIRHAKIGSGEHVLDNSPNRTRGFKSNALGALSKIMPVSIQNMAVNQILRQVAGYLDNAPLKINILNVVSLALSEGAKKAQAEGELLIVVAHSLGTVIALEALADFSERSIDLLITIGSPLSTETVASRMIQKSRSWPQVVRKWVNVSDPDDIVALHHSIDRRNFLKNCSDRDKATIWNIIDVKNHTSNHHGIVGYLDDPVVAQLLTDSKLWL
jgi:hypothetical protein